MKENPSINLGVDVLRNATTIIACVKNTLHIVQVFAGVTIV